ncbi:diguanylate cyclase [Aliidiomarina celeris]|uniref:diguanylate cyclase n=1 Tax=Aliidiomarina celeris TaxID=2249428 RepID=UPI000DEA5AB6|nr:diguanylate cyclase [Aliidiomarina celeris]
MRSFLLHTLWISLFLMLSSMAQATSNCTPTVCPYTVSEQAKQPLNQHVLMFEAPSDWTIEQVHEAYLNQQFRPALGQASASASTNAIWLRLELNGVPSGAMEQPWVLVSQSVSQRSIDFYHYSPTTGLWQHLPSGMQRPFSQGRSAPYRHANIALSLSPQHPTIVYVRYQDPVGNLFPLKLIKPQTLATQNLNEHWGFGIIVGIVLGLLLYNFVIMLQLKEASYAWYVLSTCCVLLLILDGTGFGLQYLTPELGQPRWMDRTTSSVLWGACVIQFARVLLNTRVLHPMLDRTLLALAVVFAAATALYLLGFERVVGTLTRPLALVGIALLLSTATLSMLRGNRTAVYFFVGHGVVFIAAGLMVARTNGWIAPQELNTYMFPAAVAFESIIFSLALAHRIQTLQRQHKAAVADAQLDPLTDILNRRGLDHAFQRIVQNGKGEVALLLLDLNKFKAVNDTYGHDVGDILLQAVAARIQHATRGQDAVARLGGDEYAILLNRAHVNDALARVKERLQKAFAEPVHHQGLTLHIDTCVGIAQSPVTSADYNALYRQADQALYQQKQALKNTQRTTVNEANA